VTIMHTLPMQSRLNIAYMTRLPEYAIDAETFTRWDVCNGLLMFAIDVCNHVCNPY